MAFIVTPEGKNSDVLKRVVSGDKFSNRFSASPSIFDNSIFDKDSPSSRFPRVPTPSIRPSHKASTATRESEVFFTPQDYEMIRQQLLSADQLWMDPEFPANQKSLGNSARLSRPEIKWMRPHELSNDPQFVVDGASRFDINQGQLGNCWFLAAVAALCMHKPLFDNVVPPHQTFQKGDYCGMFRFRFWRFGEWTDVIIDDRLPTIRGKLVFMHSKSKNEFWSALLEKAYTKLMGCYNALESGLTGEAMEDFTGGILEMYRLEKEKPSNLFEIIQESFSRGSLITCATAPVEGVREAERSNGIVMGHSYTMTAAKTVHIGNEVHKILRIRNPWGNEIEWNGSWGDNSREWSLVDPEDRADLGLVKDADGEFWMNIDDFMNQFSLVEICHLSPDSFADREAKIGWECLLMKGAWKKRVNDGGCINFPSFHINPQFRVDLNQPGDDNCDSVPLIVGLLQKKYRANTSEGGRPLHIGYVIYQVKANQTEYFEKRLDKQFFSSNKPIASSKTFLDTREISTRHQLPMGYYVIIPSSFNPGETREFILRVFSQKGERGREYDDVDGIHQIKNVIGNPVVKRTHSMLTQTFDDSAVSGQLNTNSLRALLNKSFPCQIDDFPKKGFSEETCRSMVAVYDTNQNGFIDAGEFKSLWETLVTIRDVYKEEIQQMQRDSHQEKNKVNRKLPSSELRPVLESLGYKISNAVNNSLIMRYSNESGAISFDDFVLCCCRLKAVYDIYQTQTKDTQGNAIFSKDQFFRAIIYV